MVERSSPEVWWAADCPAWCSHPHMVDDHPEDRFHRDGGTVVAGVVGAVDPRTMRPYAEPAACVVQRLKWPGDRRLWISVGSEDGSIARMHLSAELAADLGRTLELLSGFDPTS